MTRWQRLRHWWNGGHRWRIVRSIWPYDPEWYVRCDLCPRATVTVPGDPFESPEETT